MTGIKSLNIEVRRRAVLRVSLALFLIAPYLIWLLWIRDWTWPRAEEWIPLAGVAAGQAFWSAGLALVCGFVLFLGAQSWLTPRAKRLCEAALLFPNMIPPLFFVIAI